MKKHDWILETINNQDFSPTDFKSIGMSTADTQLLPMDDYLKSSYITDNPLFKNDDGEFSKDKFERFYNQKAGEFQAFSQDYDTFKYDLFDTGRKLDSQVKNPNMVLRQVSNPQHLTIGIGGRNEVRNGEFTDKELAQRNKIFDPETGQFLDYSVNDYALTKNPLKWLSQFFEDPIVYAAWDEDGSHIDPITSEVVEHKKGEFKINKDGEYYTEKLGDRNVRGKQVVSALDNVTVDGEGINKYDFFDADSFDKSASGSIFSAAASIAPLFGGPWTAGIYAGLLTARELSKALPMLGGMIDSVLGTDLENNSAFNFLSSKGEQFTQGTSQYAQENMFSLENMSKLVSDVAVQWGQQKLIAQSLNQLMGGRKLIDGAYKSASAEYLDKALNFRGPDFKKYFGADDLNSLTSVIKSGEWANSAVGKASLAKYLPKAQKINDKINRVGANASLAYMAIVSNTDVYESMLDKGATKGEAALFALGSTLGMYGVDRYLGLGEVFFDELANNSGKFMRRNVKEMLDSWKTTAKFGEEVKDLNRLQKIIKSGKDFGAKYANQFADDLLNHTTGFIGKAVGEGLEEVSEELVTDFTKTIYEQLGNFGVTSTNDVGAWQDAGARYLMSFLGGSLGGGIFYGVGMYNGQYPIHAADEDLLYHIRNGKTKDYLQMVDDWEKEGKFGSTELSATQKTEVTDEAGNTKEVYLTASDANDTQNHFIAQRIREGITQLDAIINGNQLNLNENQLFEQMVGAEKRYLDLRDWLQGESYVTGYQEMWQNLTNDLVKVEQDLLKAGTTIEGTVDGTPISDEWRRNHKEDTVEGRARSENLQKLMDKKEALLKQKEDFLSGDTSLYYTRKMLFALDRGLSSQFFPNTFEEFVQKNHDGVSVDSLNDIDKAKYWQEYQDYQEKEKKNVLTQEFEKFLDVEAKVAPYLQMLQENSKDFLKYSEQIDKLFEQGSPLLYKEISYLDKLDGETDEDIQRFQTIAEAGEAAPEDTEWYENRIKTIDTLNQQTRQQAYDGIMQLVSEAGGKLDPLAYRQLIYSLTRRRKEIADEIVYNALNKLSIDGVPNNTIQEVKSKLAEVTPETREEIFEKVVNLIEAPIEQSHQDKRRAIMQLQNTLSIVDESGEDGYGLTVQEVQDMLPEAVVNEEDKNKLEQYLDQQDANAIVYDLLEENLQEVERQKPDVTPIKDQIQQAMGEILTGMESNQDLKMFDSLKEKVQQSNPFINFVSQIGTGLGIDNVEEQLQFIFNQIEEIDKKDNFRLTPQQMTQLSQVEGVLNLVNAYLYAASNQASMLNPYGHNKAVNDYVNNHQSELTKVPEALPELSSEAVVLYSQEANKYLREIEYLTDLSRKNSVNKARRFLVTDEKFTKARMDSLNNIREHLKFNLNGEDVDLFEGFESVNYENDSTTQVAALEELLFNNFQNLLKKGYSVEDILSKSDIIRKLSESTTDKVYQQLSTRLDEDLDYDKFTKYDRLIHFLTTLSLNNREWHKFLKDKINQDASKVPLTVQQYVAKVGAARIDKSSIFNQALDYIEKNKILGIDGITYLKKTTFIPGIGGAGKSSVSAKYIVDYATEVAKISQDKIWLTAPTDTQRKNLKSSVVKGIEKSKEDILKTALDPTVYSKLIDDIKHDKTDSEYYSVTNLPGGNVGIKLNWDKIKLNVAAAPEVLVIDEVTHFSNAELQILDRWVKGQVISLGDPNQGGFSNIGGNINREQTFAVRTPKLRISLRDNNLQNQENQLGLSELMDELTGKEADDPDYRNSVSSFIEKFNQFKVRAYNGSKLNGTLYQNSLTEDVVDKIVKDLETSEQKSIAFVGDANSQALALLKSKGLDPKVFKAAAEIQGSEFDFVVVDYNFKAPYESLINNSDPKYSGAGYIQWAQDFYTLMSRAKTASVFINNGNLPGQNVIDSFEATAPSIMDALDQFKGPQLTAIDKYLATEPVIPIVTETKETVQEKEDVKSNPEDDEEELPLPPAESEETESDNDLLNVTEVELGEVTYPVFTNFNILGAKRELVEVNGERRQRWIPAQEGAVKRDAEIFIGSVIDPNDENYNAQRTVIEQNLRRLINGVLYGHRYSDVAERIAGLSDKISEATYNKLKENFRLESRRVDPERDLIMNPLYRAEKDPTVKAISNGKLVALVAEADGIKITLGLFADPADQTNEDTLNKREKSIDKTIKRIFTLIDQEKLDIDDPRRKAWEERLDALEERKKRLRQDATNYARAIEKITKGKEQSYKVNVTLNGFSRLFRLENPTSLSNVRKNRNISVSKPFIYLGGLPGINDKAMKGRAVVLISGDNIMGSQELMQGYIDQKRYSGEHNTLDPNNQLEHLPKTRMAVLSSTGVDLRDLLVRTVQAPMAWTQVGLKMLVSAWNFRANLKNFLTEYNNFLEENNYDSNVVQQVLVNMDAEYRKETMPYSIDNYEEIKNKVEEFNIGLANKVKEFRLGGREEEYGGRKVGSQYIRKIEGLPKDSIFYKDPDNVNGVFITPERARIYEKMLDAYFDTMSEVVSPKVPNTENPLDPTTLISASDNTANNINHYISKIQRDKTYTITLPNGQTVQLGESQKAFSAFAVGTLSIIRQAYGVASSTGEADTSNDYNGISIKVGDNKLNLDTTEILKNVNLSPDGDYVDLTFENMFRIIVHGTTENIHDGNPLKATDAYFKKGIFVEQVKGTELPGGVFAECTTDEAFFDLDAVVTSPVIQLTLGQIQERVQENIPQETLSQEAVALQQTAETFGILFEYDQTKSLEENKKSLRRGIDEQIKQNIQNIFTNAVNLDSIVGTTDNLQPIILSQYIKDKGFDISNIVEINREIDNKISIVTDKDTIVVSYDQFGESLDEIITIDSINNSEDISEYSEKADKIIQDVLKRSEELQEEDKAILEGLNLVAYTDGKLLSEGINQASDYLLSIAENVLFDSEDLAMFLNQQAEQLQSIKSTLDDICHLV